jgi:Acetyltransferase (GNAT) domain
MSPGRGVRPASEAVVRPLTEEALAAWREERGERVLERGGRFWRMSRPGFWEPVHWLARLRAAEARRPAPCLGFRAVLREEDSGAANASLAAHVLGPVPDWGPHLLSKNRRYRLRKAGRLVELVELTDAALLEAQGHEVVVSSLERTGADKPPSREDYLRSLAREGIGGPLTVFAGLQDGRLAAYLSGWAVGGTAYFQRLHIRTEALATQVGTALVFAFVEACQRGGEVGEIVNGLHSPEDESLSAYKEGIGFPVRRYPARVWFVPGAIPLLRRVRPSTAYRLTGADRSASKSLAKR